MILDPGEAASEQIGRLPDFLLIGAMKAGTTTLFSDLNQHPNVYIPPEKELAVLCEPDTPEALRERYYAYFKSADVASLCGDASTYYTMAPKITGVPARAWHTLGSELKLLYIVRDPVKRIHSQCHHIASTLEIDFDPERILKDFPEAISFSEYASQIRLWREHFRKDQIKVISLEAYSQRRIATLVDIYTFLGVDPAVASRIDVGQSHNVSKEKRLIWPGVSGVIQSRVYDLLVRRTLPRNLRHRLRALVSSRAQSTDLEFEAETRARLWKRLEPEMQELERITGIRYTENYG